MLMPCSIIKSMACCMVALISMVMTGLIIQFLTNIPILLSAYANSHDYELHNQRQKSCGNTSLASPGISGAFSRTVDMPPNYVPLVTLEV